MNRGNDTRVAPHDIMISRRYEMPTSTCCGLLLAAMWLWVGCDSGDRPDRVVNADPDSSTSAANLKDIAPLFEIGAISGSAAETFGRIRDVGVDSIGNIYILDDQALALHWYDSTGAHRGSAGRSGGGPGEFRAPMGIEVVSTGRVEVVDMAHRRLSMFAATDTGLSLEGSVETPLHAMDFCVLNGRHYLLNPQETGIIHEFDEAGVLRSFAPIAGDIPPELSRHESMLREGYARGRLLCTSSPDVIVVLHEQLPLLRAFSPDGERLWETTLANYHAIHWELTENGRGLRAGPDPESNTAHSGTFLARLGGDVLAVTLHEGSLANPEGVLETRRISLSDGRESEASAASFIVVAERDSLTYGYMQHPYPKVVVSPRARPSAMSRSSRRMILPDRVFGRSAANRMSSGFAIAPIFVTTCSFSAFRSESLGRTVSLWDSPMCPARTPRPPHLRSVMSHFHGWPGYHLWYANDACPRPELSRPRKSWEDQMRTSLVVYGPPAFDARCSLIRWGAEYGRTGEDALKARLSPGDLPLRMTSEVIE